MLRVRPPSALIQCALLLLVFPQPVSSATPINSWRGLTPLRSSVADVAKVVGGDAESFNLEASNSFKVDGGKVSFTFISASLARIYKAPRSLVSKLFTVYFKPDSPVERAELKLPMGFKRCTEQLSKRYYYLVSDGGLAYQLLSETDRVEAIIYQPARWEVRRLSVSAECVF